MSATARLLPTPAQPRRSSRVLRAIVIDIDECPRCGHPHRAIEMRRFRRASGAFIVDGARVRLVAWSSCPRTAEPIAHAELDR